MQRARGDGSYTTLKRSVLLLLLAALIPLAVMIGIAGSYLIQSQKKALDDVLRERSQRAAAAISRELEAQVQLLTILSESPRLDPPAQEPAFRELAARLRARMPMWEIVRVTDADGRIVLSEPAPPDTTVVVEQESNRRLFESGKPSIGSVVRGPGGMAAFPVRVPVSRGGETIFGLTVVIRAQALADVLHTNGLPATWAGWIEGADGTLLSSTAGDPALIGGASSSLASAAHLEGPRDVVVAGDNALRVWESPIRGLPWSVNVGTPRAEYDALTLRGYELLAVVMLATIVLFSLALLLFRRELEARRRQDMAVANWQRMDALGKLTGGVAHDFNNLLMVFQSGVESIRRRRHDEKRVDQILQLMIDAVDRGRGMTQRLLSFSRRSNRGAETVLLQDRTVVLRDLLAKAASDNNLLELVLPRNLWPVNVDPGALDAALINIVTNAREAMPVPGTISVTARNVESLSGEAAGLKGAGVAICVTDQGDGIPRQIVDRVFEPFFTTKGDAASGLGLTQVYSFAERSGGAVAADSLEGRGTAITIYLPRAEGVAETRHSGEMPATRLPRRVLVVDDTPASLAAARLAVEELGIAAVTASSGHGALSLLAERGDIDLVLSDVMMPGMSGFELRDRVRRHYPRLGMVLMTGYSEEIEKGTDVGVPLVAKPFSAQDLRQALAAAVQVLEAEASVIPFRR
ncbi:signal transduction histidine kinase/ActR/RegA family two-component response regulator [Pseudorhizobium tarimense]|uniref:histidine kinase n=1 Tax=Pseudorhizobium tarimense TaxID=1079109 RepID=A0ABV2HB23_9HYPH|nr:ATP-binding protein [Pseudorhizobium tarimense]MCJ8520666.1 response regulator [Pseudorhizobium tarimense]